MSVETNDDGTIPQAEREKLHALLDDAISAYEDDRVTLRTAVVHFERDGDLAGESMPRAHVELGARGSLSELETAQDTLAKQVVGIGLEPDADTAKAEITVNQR